MLYRIIANGAHPATMSPSRPFALSCRMLWSSKSRAESNVSAFLALSARGRRWSNDVSTLSPLKPVGAKASWVPPSLRGWLEDSGAPFAADAGNPSNLATCLCPKSEPLTAMDYLLSPALAV